MAFYSDRASQQLRFVILEEGLQERTGFRPQFALIEIKKDVAVQDEANFSSLLPSSTGSRVVPRPGRSTGSGKPTMLL